MSKTAMGTNNLERVLDAFYGKQAVQAKSPPSRQC